jgi:hypothetical protein
MNYYIPIRSLAALLASCFLPLCCLAQLPSATKSLWDELLDVTEKRLKTTGPDYEIAQFISMARESAWARRETFFTLSRSYLDDTNTAKVSAAIEVLYHVRVFHPRGWVGGPTFEEVRADFFARLDAAVFGHFSHFKSLHNDAVYKSLSLYLGTTHSAEARRQLREIAETTKNNEQTLIGLAWHRDPADMDFLLPYMLADSPASRSLPYHFRNSYRQAASPYLRRALSEAKSQATRLEAAFELVHLRVPEGFMYLEDVALKDPEPQGKSARPLERIKQFVADYLASYVGIRKDAYASLKEDIAAQLRKARLLLCEGKR